MESVEKAVAKSLMDIKAVMLRPDQPFVWASGWHSPIYCDNRRILSFPEIRENVCTWMADIIRKQYPEVEVIAGVATGAIAHGYLVAHILGKPFCYVRPKPKDHGTGSQIEGILEPGSKVVIVEDLISTGMSSLAAKNALVMPVRMCWEWWRSSHMASIQHARLLRMPMLSLPHFRTTMP